MKYLWAQLMIPRRFKVKWRIDPAYRNEIPNVHFCFRMVEVNGQMEEMNEVAERVWQSMSLNEINKRSQWTKSRSKDVDGRGDELWL